MKYIKILFICLLAASLHPMLFAASSTSSSSSSSSSSSTAAIPTSASTYKKECLALVMSKLNIPGVAQIVCDYKGTINTHDTVLQWLCNPQKPKGWEGFSISNDTQQQCKSHVNNHAFPIAGFKADNSLSSNTLYLFLKEESTAPFTVQFFNTHDPMWFENNEGYSNRDAHRLLCSQKYTYSLTTHQLTLTENFPLGKQHSNLSHRGNLGISFAGDTSITTPIPTPPAIAIHLYNERLRLVVVDHDENMSEPTKNHCFDYWFEKPSTYSSSSSSSST